MLRNAAQKMLNEAIDETPATSPEKHLPSNYAKDAKDAKTKASSQDSHSKFLPPKNAPPSAHIHKLSPPIHKSLPPVHKLPPAPRSTSPIASIPVMEGYDEATGQTEVLMEGYDASKEDGEYGEDVPDINTPLKHPYIPKITIIIIVMIIMLIPVN